MQVKLLIFDLDGTLVDTSRDITNALNYSIKPYGMRELTVEDTIKLIGEGISSLIKKLLGENKIQIYDEVKQRFLDHYSEHLTDYSKVYPQVRETLEALGNYKKAIISNKMENLSEKLLDELDLRRYFNMIAGSDTAPERKPSPVPVRYVCSKLGVEPQESIMIGDSNFDIEAGKMAGAKTIAVTYGYRDIKYLTGADFIIDRFNELLPILDITSYKLI